MKRTFKSITPLTLVIIFNGIKPLLVSAVFCRCNRPLPIHWSGCNLWPEIATNYKRIFPLYSRFYSVLNKMEPGWLLVFVAVALCIYICVCSVCVFVYLFTFASPWKLNSFFSIRHNFMWQTDFTTHSMCCEDQRLCNVRYYPPWQFLYFSRTIHLECILVARYGGGI